MTDMVKQIERVHICEDGTKLTLLPVRMVALQTAVAAVEGEFRARGKKIDPPTYEIKTISGEIEVHELTEEDITADDDGFWEPRELRRHKTAWREHKAALNEMEKAQAEREFKALFTLGIDHDAPEDDDWTRELAFLGISIPKPEDDPYGFERKFCYLWYVVLSATDKAMLQTKLMMLSAGGSVSEDQMARFQDIIQPAMEKQIRQGVENAIGQLEEAIRDVVDEPAPVGDNDSEGMAPDPG